ncbi:hypothetical protein ACFQX7_27510 [Luedemannella flava]
MDDPGGYSGAGGWRHHRDAGAEGADTPMSWLQAALTDPNVVFVLLSLAVIALVTEVATPRKRLAGSFGLLLLLLAGYGMAGLPVQLPGAVLMLLAAGLFLAETMTGEWPFSRRAGRPPCASARWFCLNSR